MGEPWESLDACAQTSHDDMHFADTSVKFEKSARGQINGEWAWRSERHPHSRNKCDGRSAVYKPIFNVKRGCESRHAIPDQPIEKHLWVSSLAWLRRPATAGSSLI
jgi:hypothetical protein